MWILIYHGWKDMVQLECVPGFSTTISGGQRLSYFSFFNSWCPRSKPPNNYFCVPKDILNFWIHFKMLFGHMMQPFLKQKGNLRYWMRILFTIKNPTRHVKVILWISANLILWISPSVWIFNFLSNTSIHHLYNICFMIPCIFLYSQSQ